MHQSGLSPWDAHSILQDFPTAVAVTGKLTHGNEIVFVNKAFTGLTGYSAEECIGQRRGFLLGPESDRVAIAELHQAVDEARPVRRDIQIYRKDGSPCWAELSISPLMRGGELDGFILSFNDVSERHRVADEQREAAEYLAGVVRNMPGYIFRRVARADGRVEYFGAPESMADPGSTSAKLRKFDPFRDMHPDDVERIKREVDESIATRTPLNCEFRIRTDGGEERWLRAYSTPRVVGDDVVWDGVGIDVTAEKEQGAWLETITDNMPGFLFRRIYKTDGRTEYPYLSPSLTRRIGLEQHTVVDGETFWKFLHPEDVAMVRRAIDASARDLTRLVIECRMILANGEERWFRTYSTPKRLPNGEVVWDGVGIDVTSEKSVSQRLDYLGSHDVMTGLPNRSHLVEALAAAILRARTSGEAVELSYVMLTGLSEIHETLGASEGDAALKYAAARISELAAADGSLAARIGNGELAVLRHGPRAEADDDFAAILMRSLSQPIPLGDDLVMIEPCIGTAVLDLSDEDGTSAESVAAELMKRASMALSAAHREGPGTHLFYRDTLDHRKHHRMVLRHSLHRAIEADEFVLHYQPLVDLSTGEIIAAEALVRWQHSRFGLVRPDVFISLAEESGLIGMLGDWVLRRALRQLKQWEAAGIILPKLAINVSAIQVKTRGFAASLRQILNEYGIPPGQIELEITEGTLLENSGEVIAALEEIKATGVSIAIDDFGAGHSSLQYLREFAIDTVKIDQMFVRQLVVDSSDALIVKAIASLARSLKLELVAEGIETVEQWDFLRDQGCTVGQGYLFSLPLEPEDLGWMLENRISLPVPALRNSRRGGGTGATS